MRDLHPVAPTLNLSSMLTAGAPAPSNDGNTALATDHPCTIEEAAVLDFEPWDSEASRMLDADQWKDEMAVDGRHAIALRIAATILVKAKPELVECTRAMSQDGNPELLSSLYDDLTHTAGFLECMCNYARTAALRLLCCASAVALEDDVAAAATSNKGGHVA